MKSHFRRAIGAFLLLGVLGLTTAGTTIAQNQFDDAKLESFVTAALAVNELVQQWTPRIQGAENEQEATQLTEQANAELEAAVEERGDITVEEYKQIAQAARTDPGLSARIEKIFKSRLQQQE